MSLRSPAEHENQIFVMPAWIAGNQVRKDASGNIHVNLDSSTPCWNDAIGLLELTDASPALILRIILKAEKFHWTRGPAEAPRC